MTTITTPTTTRPTSKPSDRHATVGRWAGMDSMRKAALIGGVLYLVTFAFSVPTLALKATISNHPGAFVLGSGSESAVMWGGFMDIVCGLAGIGTAVALYNVAKRYCSWGARGFLASRTLEASMLFAGALALFAAVTVRHDLAGSAATNHASMVAAGTALVAFHKWAFLLGPGVMPAINALFIGTAMYRSRLIPRWMPTLGLIGAPLLLTSAAASIFAGTGQVSGISFLLTLPIAVWEFALGVYLTFKGFKKPSA
jgi:hypothetical protein